MCFEVKVKKDLGSFKFQKVRVYYASIEWKESVYNFTIIIVDISWFFYIRNDINPQTVLYI